MNTYSIEFSRAIRILTNRYPVYLLILIISFLLQRRVLLDIPMANDEGRLPLKITDINITVNRLASSTEIDLQLEAQSIINSDINDDANIAQNKIMMNRAGTLADSTGLLGVDGDGTNGRTGQTSRGLAAFEDESFAEDITEDLMEAFKKVEERQKKKKKKRLLSFLEL